MKLDINLVREILLRLEPLSANYDEPIPLTVGDPPLDIPDYTNKQIVYHIRIMTDGGLINHTGLTGPDGIRIARFLGLSWNGHEFWTMFAIPKYGKPRKRCSARSEMPASKSYGRSLSRNCDSN
jgi:hypothetical protein